MPPQLPPTPSESQRQAIEAAAAPLLVLAGPGAGKTFCLVERIRFLIETLGFAPDRLCAFTFTNKAAGEIAERLTRFLGEKANYIKSGTIHSFCAELLREFGSRIGLQPGFGIADEIYQRAVLRRLGVHSDYHKGLLSAFSRHRLRDESLDRRDADRFHKYEEFMEQRRMVDFDTLLLRMVELLSDAQVIARLRARWDCVLVDEFQDLNPLQYSVVREIGRSHGHVFAVGDDEQSIFSWTGADPQVFNHFQSDFPQVTKVPLRDNRRCPRQIVALARRLIAHNPTLFDRSELDVGRDSPFPVSAHSFPTADDEAGWLIEDITRDQATHHVPWGEIALLYRSHTIGDALESAFLANGIPCRLAQGRALAEDPVIGYVIAAINVIVSPDDIHKECYLDVVLPKDLMDRARARAVNRRRSVLDELHAIARELGRDHVEARKIRRGFCVLDNLVAMGRRHTKIAGLVEELLSQRVGEFKSVLEERHDELSDPAASDEVVKLSEKMRIALESGTPIHIARMGGLEIALKGMLTWLGTKVILGEQTFATDDDLEDILTIPSAPIDLTRDDAPGLGLGLGVFKAAQLIRSRGFANEFRSFTAIDIESTSLDVETAEVIEIAAVRVRDGVIVAEYQSLVRPDSLIHPESSKVHGIRDADVAHARSFEKVWPEFRAFCGTDVLVAHNGNTFDFPVLRRLAVGLDGCDDMCPFDTLPLARELQNGSAGLADLARAFGIDPGRSHRALDDTRTLVQVCLRLHEAKVVRARKTVLLELLDHLGIALTLTDIDAFDPEACRFKDFCAGFTLSRYSDCLETYRTERELAEDSTIPTVRDVIARLGGEEVLRRVRTERNAWERYPSAMGRLRGLLTLCSVGSLTEQICDLLDRIALSRSDGADAARDRINLLTLHATKGLEFSRVYIVGVEDAQLPGVSKKGKSKAEIEEMRRLLYVGMTRVKDRLVLTRVEDRAGVSTGGHQFLDEMGLTPASGGSLPAAVSTAIQLVH
jgi:superfamily I DNA/RNA helicase/inhibitor of KinA sporulation pathway (predicted exonuclease)